MNAKNLLLESIPGIGKITLNKLHSEGLYNAKDLLLAWPKKYNVYEPMTLSQAELQIGASCLAGKIISRIGYVYYNPHLSAITFDISVEDNKIHVIMFNRQYLKKVLKVGLDVKVYGKYNKYKKEIAAREVFVGSLEGHIDVSYKIKDVPDKTINRLVNNAIEMGALVEDYLPDFCFNKYQFVDINKMINLLHNPTTLMSVYEARRRRKYEEILEFYIEINHYRNLREAHQREPIKYDKEKIQKLITKIPFAFTEDQKKVTNDILRDMRKYIPCNRIIEGDVGSGKTIVSLLIAYAFNTAKKQVVLMAPTEILANQHYKYFKNYLDSFNVNIALFTASTKKKEKEQMLADLANGNIDILIGTHAIYYENIKYHDLGLAIIDEQHRFGVDARNKLLNDNVCDALYLSATPIPRTLALTMFSDLDISAIKTVRKDKLPIKTKVLANDKLADVINNIRHELYLGHQGYFVVSAIDAKEDNMRYDIDEVKELLELNLPDYKIGVIHGKLKDKEKEEIMKDFLDKKYDILVSTTVIEVGISVDNATFIVVLDSQNFGLATLHQLRGRVGRANLQGYCYLLSDDIDIERLHVLEESNDGFYLAERDLKMRGPGEYFGERQSGVSDFVFANFEEDYDLFQNVNQDAKTLFLLKENDKKTSDYIDNILSNIKIVPNLN